MLLRLVIVELHLTSRLVMREQLSLHISTPPLYYIHIFVQTETDSKNFDLRHASERRPMPRNKTQILPAGIPVSVI